MIFLISPDDLRDCLEQTCTESVSLLLIGQLSASCCEADGGPENLVDLRHDRLPGLLANGKQVENQVISW